LLYRSDIQIFVNGLCEFNQDPLRFKLNLRDFLVNVREYAAADSTDLFQEDKEAEAQRIKEEERQKAQAVPGMLKPSEVAQGEDEEL
jgi:exportin-1